MKIKVKHKDIEIEVDDNDNTTTIKYSAGELIKVIEKISYTIQSIENNYDKVTYGGNNAK